MTRLTISHGVGTFWKSLRGSSANNGVGTRVGDEGKLKNAFLCGNLIVDGDRWLGREGMGAFLKRGESGRL